MKQYEVWLNGPVSSECWVKVEFTKYPSAKEYQRFLDLLNIIKVSSEVLEDAVLHEMAKEVGHEPEKDFFEVMEDEK